MFHMVTGNKTLLFIRGVITLCAVALGFFTQAYAHTLEQTDGLKRFDRQLRLNYPANPAQTLQSELDIKDVKLGQNALNQAISLSEKGGEIHTITGGSRSDKVTFSFFQPYQESRLEQRIDLYFNKNSGFIHQVNLRYLISSAYLSIEPVRAQVLQTAIAKYGKPLSMQDIRDRVKQAKGEIKLRHFAETLQDSSEATVTFFKKMSFARNAQISSDNQDYALFPAGFDQCYVWSRDNFNELLTFCGFAPNAANAASRGLEFSLVNFAIADIITEQQHQSVDAYQLTL
jgi:hypothetical protein